MGPSRCKSVLNAAYRQKRYAQEVRSSIAALLVTVGIMTMGASRAHADAGGLSFWLPGLMGSLAAAPGQPGWSWATIYIHLQERAGGSKEFIKGGSVVTGINARADAAATGPSYTFATPIFGGQAAFGVFAVPGNVGLGINATLTGPRGNTVSGSRHDERTTFSDVFYQGTLKWNQGVHNEMVYFTGNIPSGTYDPGRLANLSLGYVAIDGGAGYTYLNPQTGNEFSVVAGLTYNFINPDTQYQNGIDFHLDWGASKFITKEVLVGLVGYYFQQLTGDSGAGARLGDFKGRVLGIGPQIGFLFPMGEEHQGYLNLKAYHDFDAQNRPEGYTMWVSFAITPAAPHEAPQAPLTRRY